MTMIEPKNLRRPQATDANAPRILKSSCKLFLSLTHYHYFQGVIGSVVFKNIIKAEHRPNISAYDKYYCMSKYIQFNYNFIVGYFVSDIYSLKFTMVYCLITQPR